MNHPNQPEHAIEGETKLVSGDWLLDGDRLTVAYEAVSVSRWSGGVEPLVTRKVAEAIVADQIQTDALDPSYREIVWDGDALVYTPEDGETYRVEPVGGCYNVGFGWAWFTLDELELSADDGPRCVVTSTAPDYEQLAKPIYDALEEFDAMVMREYGDDDDTGDALRATIDEASTAVVGLLLALGVEL